MISGAIHKIRKIYKPSNVGRMLILVSNRRKEKWTIMNIDVFVHQISAPDFVCVVNEL